MKLKLNPIRILTIFPLLLLISCNAFKMPEYKDFKNLKVEKWGMAESTVTMDLVYYNPNKIGFQVKRTEADVYVDGVYLGKAISDTLIKVAKRSDFVIPLRIKADMKNVFKNAWSALSNKTVLIKANGTISAGVAGIFKSIPMNYEGRHEMGLFVP